MTSFEQSIVAFSVAMVTEQWEPTLHDHSLYSNRNEESNKEKSEQCVSNNWAKAMWL